MQDNELLPHLFRTEYQKIIAVLSRLFGTQHLSVVEDLVSDTFLSAAELWGLKGLPENPTAWLYTVAKNKTRNYLKRDAIFASKIRPELLREQTSPEEWEIDLSAESVTDSQLAMLFTVCDPSIPVESQIALSLNLLCGFGVQEIADAFLTNKEVIYKRLNRAKEKLKAEGIKIESPTAFQVDQRLTTVLTTLYLLFNEGYYSASQDIVLRKDFCLEALRLTYLLAHHELTSTPEVKALVSLMCFHASRFEARQTETGEIILYEDQDDTLWDRALIEKGLQYLNDAATGSRLSRFHLEAGIAYWHTHKKDSAEKWEAILQLYNQLLQIAYSPIAALNRTYALAKTAGSPKAIEEAEKLNLVDNHFYFSLLGTLYQDIDRNKAIAHFQHALSLVHSAAERVTIQKNISRLQRH